MTEQENKVSIHIPAEQVSKIAPLYEEWSSAREAMLGEVNRDIDAAVKLTEIRTSFFDKLILLATGSFALSLTLLGSLHRQSGHDSPLQALGRLKISWVLMLMCVLFGWFHNLYRCASIERLSAAARKVLMASRFAVTNTFMIRASEIFKETQAEEVNIGEFFRLSAAYVKQQSDEALKQVSQFSNDATRISRHANWLGSIAIWSIVIAFILLLSFAIKNAALL